MLEQFQQAFADLTASPSLVSQARLRPEMLREKYALTDIEWRRLQAVVNHKGMECNCMLYRANRLIPVAMNLPAVCKALGDDLRDIASAYWTEFPRTDVHFLLEAHRFCEYLLSRMRNGEEFSSGVNGALEKEMAELGTRLEKSYVREDRTAE